MFDHGYESCSRVQNGVLDTTMQFYYKAMELIPKFMGTLSTINEPKPKIVQFQQMKKPLAPPNVDSLKKNKYLE